MMRLVSEQPLRAVVSIAEMSRLLGLSRQRFYQLQGTTFPWPVYDIVTRRPLYTEELQRVCLEVRRRNCGIDGKPILFYARRPTPTAVPKERRPKSHTEIAASLRALGLSVVTGGQIESAAKKLFPQGTGNMD